MTKLLYFGTCMLMLMLFGCGWNGTPTRNDDFTPLTSIEITAELSTIASRTSTKLSAKGNFSDLYSRDITDKVVWSSLTPSVAAFNSTTTPSRISAISPGTASVTATLDGVTSTYNLTVSSASIKELAITPPNVLVANGGTTQYSVTALFSDSTTQDLTFDATWSSSAVGVAKISNDEATKGLATALNLGTATITATVGTTISSSKMIVTEAKIESITLSEITLNMNVGEAPKPLILTAKYSDNSEKVVTTDAQWESDAVTIATVGNTIAAEKGFVTAVAAGTANITASYLGKTASSVVTVAEATKVVKSLAVTHNTNDTDATVEIISISIGTPETFVAKATYEDNTSEIVTDKCTWTSSEPTKATVDNGVVTPVLAGSTTITVTFGGTTKTINITVK